MAEPSVNNEIYDRLGENWYSGTDHPIALLRAQAKVEGPWVVQQIQKYISISKPRILDVGCGAGILTNALAQQGFAMTGIDLSEPSLQIARGHDQTRTAQYIKANASALPFPNGSFDVVIAMDFLEHVENPQQVIREISRVLKAGGIFIFHTFNRNRISQLVVIKLVEWFIKNTPQHLHVLPLFIKPDELKQYCSDVGLHVEKWVGLRPQWKLWPLLKIAANGKIPETFQFRLTKSLKISYMGVAIKKE